MQTESALWRTLDAIHQELLREIHAVSITAQAVEQEIRARTIAAVLQVEYRPPRRAPRR